MDARWFRWDELDEDAPMALLTRKRVIGDKAMISRVVLEAGCSVPTHSHANEQIVCVLEGELRLDVGEPVQPVTVGAGEVLLIPSNVPHSAHAVRRTVVLDVFSPPSERTGIDVHGA